MQLNVFLIFIMNATNGSDQSDTLNSGFKPNYKFITNRLLYFLQ